MFIKNYLKEILLIFNILLVLGLYVFPICEMFFVKENFQKEELKVIEEEIVEFEEQSINEEKLEEKIIKQVEVKGDVKRPGVYSVVDTNVINDVIKMAGGFNKSAYQKNINLSKKVKDEMVIYVYSQEEYKLLNKEDVKYEEEIECKCDNIFIDSCTQDGSSVIVPNDNVQDNNQNNEVLDEKQNALININTALKEKLMELNGIGDAKAQNIIDYRQQNGNFKVIEDIMNVSGISENVFEKIKNSITV